MCRCCLLSQQSLHKAQSQCRAKQVCVTRCRCAYQYMRWTLNDILAEWVEAVMERCPLSRAMLTFLYTHTCSADMSKTFNSSLLTDVISERQDLSQSLLTAPGEDTGQAEAADPPRQAASAASTPAEAMADAEAPAETLSLDRAVVESVLIQASLVSAVGCCRLNKFSKCGGCESEATLADGCLLPPFCNEIAVIDPLQPQSPSTTHSPPLNSHQLGCEGLCLLSVDI